MKKLIQVYKGLNQWGSVGPPGFGDFIRGVCHLYEKFENNPDIQLYIDLSQSEFSQYIIGNENILYQGDQEKIISAPTYFVDHEALNLRLEEFCNSSEEELYLSTNLGDWSRLQLPSSVKEFAKKLYAFDPNIENEVLNTIGTRQYAVLSIRCGDHYFGGSSPHELNEIPQTICTLIEQEILPKIQVPILVTSDHYELKLLLAKKYGFLKLDHKSEHGAYGNVLPVIKDLCALKNSSHNFYINTWTGWWSGFSHYTSMIFGIPSSNFRSPEYRPEHISSVGELT